MKLPFSFQFLVWSSIYTLAAAFRVPIADTDSLREVCSGMYGGKGAEIEVTFNPTSTGQVALVIYEWEDAKYLGIQPEESETRTYICTTSAIRSSLCSSSQLGSFITSGPPNSTNIFTTPLRFSTTASSPIVSENNAVPFEGDFSETDSTGSHTASNTPRDAQYQDTDGKHQRKSAAGFEDHRSLRQLMGRQADINSFKSVVENVVARAGILKKGNSSQSDSDGISGGVSVPTYSIPITYPVTQTGYYCVGIVPVTLVNSRRWDNKDAEPLKRRAATHAEYSGLVLFKNTFKGELPASEYPKINFYLILTIIYFLGGCGWTYLCCQHLKELLPMQYYISGALLFLIIENISQFAYYWYINRYGGGTPSIVFLLVISILNAGRNSLSLFLVLIISMGLSVVRQSLGSVVTKVRILTALHFIFGVIIHTCDTVDSIQNASLMTVAFLIFPLSLTLTSFLMWIILSLNSTILHLEASKQHYKLQMFKKLWRILVAGVIGVACVFVVSGMSLSRRGEEDYAPNSWKYRWIILDGSLTTIYLCIFAALSWLWRPTRDNVRFSMSQELAQDEHEADAEDYDLESLENGRGLGYSSFTHQPLSQHEDEDKDHERSHKRRNLVNASKGHDEESEHDVVFAMGEDSDDDNDQHGATSVSHVEERQRKSEDTESISGRGKKSKKGGERS
nr:hypothetical protein L203_06630 [Cryptococcus depauperatus CBS 7841]